MKKTYIIPVLCITTLGVENMIASSGLETNDGPASQEAGMEVKQQTVHSYNVWNDDWSK